MIDPTHAGRGLRFQTLKASCPLGASEGPGLLGMAEIEMQLEMPP